MPRLHRNNAAEWVMVIVLTPFAWMIRGWKKVPQTRAGIEPGGSAAGASGRPKNAVKRSVMIEGLPPRTLN